MLKETEKLHSEISRNTSGNFAKAVFHVVALFIYQIILTILQHIPIRHQILAISSMEKRHLAFRLYPSSFSLLALEVGWCLPLTSVVLSHLLRIILGIVLLGILFIQYAVGALDCFLYEQSLVIIYRSSR